MIQKQKKIEEKNAVKLLKEIEGSNTDEIRTVDDNLDDDLNDDDSVSYHESRAQNGDSKMSQLTVVSFGTTPVQKFDFESLAIKSLSDKQIKFNGISFFKNESARIRTSLQRSNTFNTSRGFFRNQNFNFEKDPFLSIRKPLNPKTNADENQNLDKKIINSDMRTIGYRTNPLEDFRTKRIVPYESKFVNFVISNSAPKN